LNEGENTVASKQREFLKAQALRDFDAADELDAQLTDAERGEYYLLALALFAGALGHRLGENPTREEIDKFVAEMRYDYRNAEPKVNFVALEAMIRGVYGEDHLIDDLPAQDQYLVQIPTIIKIVAQSEEMRASLDDYLTDAEALASQWQSES
jgi:hypothetical protein